MVAQPERLIGRDVAIFESIIGQDSNSEESVGLGKRQVNANSCYRNEAG